MQYVMLVRVDPELAAATPDTGEPTEWVEEGAATGTRDHGDPLEDPDTATTVRVRGGEVLLADGPYVETKEVIAGYDLLEARDLDAAVDYASRHPVAAFGALEVREVWSDFVEGGAPTPPEPVADGVEYLFVHAPAVDGAVEQQRDPEEDLVGWVLDVERRRITLGGWRLRDADAGTSATVRSRDGRVVVSRGPYAELAEQVAGLDRIRVADLDEALEVAAGHPTARLGAIEVRPVGSL